MCDLILPIGMTSAAEILSLSLMAQNVVTMMSWTSEGLEGWVGLFIK